MSADPAFVKAILATLDAGTRHGSVLTYPTLPARRTTRGLLQLLERDDLSPVRWEAAVTREGAVHLCWWFASRRVRMLIDGKDIIRCQFNDGQSVWTDHFGQASDGKHLQARNLLSWVEGMPSWDDQFPGVTNAWIAEDWLAQLAS